ncbi:T9SS type A sorting domain-containing protein [Nonlabens xiamenensis]|uniref:T9SS type A sorting domain-containing protein n=1 Tax=Nonlabens xiamenensis TaxID=2341043 RepID=UPI000F6129CB|nr:T9SS type A sorting domain-containing protein [Nonlabens xiamenensis]
MKQIYTFYLLLLVSSISMAQVMYNEDFSTPIDNTGVEGITGGGIINIGDYPSNVAWTIDASAASLTANSDWAKLTGGIFSFRDTDGPTIWESESIDISTATGAFNFSVAASNNNGGFESSDYLDILYSIDGGAYVLVQDWNNLGDATHTFLGEKNGTDWNGTTPEIVTVSGLTGTSTLQIRVVAEVNAGGEEMFFDDINVFEGAPAPSLSITSPADNEVLASGDFNVSFLVNNFNVAQSGGDGYVQYALDAAAPVDKFDTTDISFTGIASGQHSITLELVDNSGNSLTPSVLQTVNFEVAASQQVANIAALRAVTLPSTTVYTVTGEVFVTHTESFRNQKWIQDATAGIVIDDNNGIITTALVRGDGVTGVTGTLSEFNGLLQLTPTADTGAPTSTGNVTTPEIVTISDLNTNPEDYESEIVQINGVTYDNADGVITFSNGSEEPISVGSDTFMHRSLFGASYDGEIVPTAPTDLAGFITQRSNGYFIQPRNNDDISTLSTGSLNQAQFIMYPNPVDNGIVRIENRNAGDFEVTIYSALGQAVLQTKNIQSEINVSNLDAGLYIVKISQNGAAQTRKLVIK